MNRDYSDMLSALSGANAEFLLVGAFALAVHGHPRATGDIDIWVRPTPENARRVIAGLKRFGAPMEGVSESDLCQQDLIFQIGVRPRRIDVITSIDGVTFDEAWAGRAMTDVDGQMIPVISRADLLRNKLATGRAKDLADADALRGDG